MTTVTPIHPDAVRVPGPLVNISENLDAIEAAYARYDEAVLTTDDDARRDLLSALFPEIWRLRKLTTGKTEYKRVERLAEAVTKEAMKVGREVADPRKSDKWFAQ